MPIGLFWFAIPAWMAATGAGAADVASVLGLTALPWSLKLVNAFADPPHQGRALWHVDRRHPADCHRLGGIGAVFAWLALANILAIIVMLVAAFPTRQIDHATVERLPQADGLTPAVN